MKTCRASSARNMQDAPTYKGRLPARDGKLSGSASWCEAAAQVECGQMLGVSVARLLVKRTQSSVEHTIVKLRERLDG